MTGSCHFEVLTSSSLFHPFTSPGYLYISLLRLYVTYISDINFDS